jgi:hypothetical protein
MFGASPQFNDYIDDEKKKQVVFENPAVLKVFCLQCDLFSLGNIYCYQKDIEMPDDAVLKLFNNPNPFQSKSQFLWDLMFWIMTGTAYVYLDSNVAENDTNCMYLLDSSKMEFPRELEKVKDKLVFSKQTLQNLGKLNVKYRYEDGETKQIPLSKIICITDLTNGIGNWYKGKSRIDALYKVISNSEMALDAANVNLDYSMRFLVGGTQDPKDVTKTPMGEEEKKSIENIFHRTSKRIHAVKSMIEIKRFVEDMRALELGKAYLDQYFIIGSMYNIPRDVLEAFNSSTYENQEKARASHVTYTLEPKGNDFVDAIANRFDYPSKNKKICISWDHLPFMQVFESDRAKVKNMNVQTLTTLMRAGVKFEAANKFLDLGFKKQDYEKPGKKGDQTDIGPGEAA